jgi:fatty acid CoA ligase FadD9
MNVDDMFTRLLYSVIVTGLAPASFYVPAPDGSRAKAHYDALPVDFVAAFIAGIGAEPHQGRRTFNVLNHHADDGLSLDVFVDWIEAAGYPVTRVADFDEWFARFEAALRALPEDRRHRSSLAVIESLRHPSTTDRPKAACGRFDDALRTLKIGPETPRLDREYIHKCLDDMRRLGLIPSRGI